MSVLLGLSLSGPAAACCHPLTLAERLKDPDALRFAYRDDLIFDRLIKRCVAELPALEVPLQALQARWEDGGPMLQAARKDAASRMPQDRAAQEKEAYALADDALETQGAKHGLARACRESTEELLIRRAESQATPGSADLDKLPPEQFAALQQGLMLEHVAERCRWEAPAEAPKAAKDVARWQAGNERYQAAVRFLGNSSDYWSWRRMANLLAEDAFDMYAAVGGAADTCNDVVGNFEPGDETGAAPDYESALAHFHYLMLFHEELAPACSTRYPALAREVDAAVAAWNSRESGFIDASKAQVAKLRAQNPAEVADGEDKVRRLVAYIFGQATGDDGGESFCRDSFKDVAGGTWRSKEPKIYEVLLKGRPAG